MNHPSSLVDCPCCGAPAESVPWHEASSARRAGSFRHKCLFGHWSLATSCSSPD